MIVALFLALPAVLPLAAPGYFFKAHDAHHSVFWLVEYDQAVRDGALWPMWAPDHVLGFGYPLWLVYAPLSYAAAEVFHLLGLGFTAAVKATWALGFLLGAAGIYALTRRWWGQAAGMVAALAYTYAPYHLVQIYVRADLAEFMAWSWFPWVLLALVALWEQPRPRRAAVAGVALGALLLLHTISPLIFAPFLLAFFLLKLTLEWRTARRFPVSRLLMLALAAGLGGVLAAIFLVPALFELRYVVASQFATGTYAYTLHYVYLNQFLDPTWGFGFSVPGPADGMSFQLGLLPFLGAVGGGAAALVPGRSPLSNGETADGTARLPHRAEALFFVAASALALFMMTGASEPVWRALPLGPLVQFPWRLLGLTMITLALLAGAAVWWMERGKRGGPWPYVAALVIVAASLPYTQPQLQPIRPQDESPLAVLEFETSYQDMIGMTAWAGRQPRPADSPLVRQYLAGEALQRAAIAGGDGSVIAQGAAAESAWAEVDAQSPVHLRFYTNYFPGWQATIDGQAVTLAPDAPLGLIGLDVPTGRHTVRLRFGPTPLRRAAAGVSLAGLGAAVALFLLDWRRRG